MSFHTPLSVAATIVQQNDYVSLGIVTAITYDYALTFSAEVEHIWNQPWTWVSTLFILLRYFGLLSAMIGSLLGSSFIPGPADITKMFQPRAGVCSVLYVLDVWCCFIFFGSADLLMVLRLWAMYDQSRIVLISLLAIYATELVLVLISCFVLTTQKVIVATTTQVLAQSFCTSQINSNFWLKMLAATQVILGGMICLLVIIRFISKSVRMYSAIRQFQLGRYMNLFVKEGIIYFLSIMSYALLNLFAFIAHIPTEEGWVLLGALQWIPAFTLMPRFVLGLRELYAHDVRGRCKGEIDTAFGFTSGFGQDEIASGMVFADVRRNEGVPDPEDAICMGAVSVCSTSGA